MRSQGKAADYFVLILEGRVEVTIGKENLVFESGPFSHFGYQALTAVPTHSHPTIGMSNVLFVELSHLSLFPIQVNLRRRSNYSAAFKLFKRHPHLTEGDLPPWALEDSVWATARRYRMAFRRL